MGHILLEGTILMKTKCISPRNIVLKCGTVYSKKNRSRNSMKQTEKKIKIFELSTIVSTGSSDAVTSYADLRTRK